MILSLLSAAAHVALVLLFTGRPAPAVAYFVGAAGLVLVRRLVPPELRKVYVVLALTALVGLTIWFRGEAPTLGLGRVDRVVRLNLAFLGVSYAFLRTARAILAPREMGAVELLRYWFFFPTFFSGPITEPPLEALGPPRRPAMADVTAGLGRIIAGVVRVGASYLLLPLVPLAATNNLTFALERWSAPALWVGAFASGVWLYLNFSGFSEIFIGLARALGVRVPENFAHPYAATNLTDFWQRWHISLGSWLRATVYSPLSRRLVRRSEATAAVLAPVITMAVCGAWHGLTGPFLVWGLLHGLGLAAHQIWQRGPGARISSVTKESFAYRAGAWGLTHGFITLAWVFFLPVGALDLGFRLRVLGALFGGGG